MSTQDPNAGQNWKRVWDARLAALKPILGAAGDGVFHALAPTNADVVPFPNHLSGATYVTAALTGEDVGQKPNSLGNYELMICVRSDNQAAINLISRLAQYTFDAVLEPGDTIDIRTAMGDSTLRALLFTHPSDAPATFTMEGRKCGLLLCVGITEAEVAFRHANGADALIERLRTAHVFPYTVPNRKSVVPELRGFWGQLWDWAKNRDRA
ncbi:MAG: suppressor of fused domain protein [Planctomycetota bacterium]|nr:suppressor of fused domain protein [Planctomycetota bacterium]